MSNFNVTAMSARVLMKVLQGVALETALSRYQDAEVHPQISHLCFEAMRHYFSLAERLQAVVDRPTNRLDLEVWCILLAAAAQIEHSRTPRHAAVFSAVDATRKLGKTSASALVNAVLRRYRTNEPLHSPEAVHELPQWLLDCIDEHYSDQKTGLIGALNSRAPLTIRVNPSKLSARAFCRILENAGISFQLPEVADAVVLDQPRPMASIPGYQEGYFAVQDLSSQLAVPLLEPHAGDRILDACAAPGIKTAQIYELYSDCTVDSYDLKGQCSTWNIRSKSPLNAGFSIQKADLRNVTWWDGEPYQRVLLDVPCSGTGTLRRHPDIKATRTLERVSQLAELQLQLLHSLWKTLGVGGRLVYCTCSILHEENDDVIGRFIEVTPNAKVECVPTKHGEATSFGRQVLPAMHHGDGFYFSCLRKFEE